MTLDELITRLQKLREQHGNNEVFVDCCLALAEIEDVDMGGSDEGVIIWLK
jgi:hypothetical protein